MKKRAEHVEFVTTDTVTTDTFGIVSVVTLLVLAVTIIINRRYNWI